MEEQQIKDFITEITHRWLNEQKDSILLQLVGFIMDKKAELENKIGSGEVQKIFVDLGDEKEAEEE